MFGKGVKSLNIQFHLNLLLLILPLTDVDDSCSDWGGIYELAAATVRKSDPTIPTPTIHTENLSGVIKIFALTEGAAMLIAEAEYFMVRDVNFGGRPTNSTVQLAPQVSSHQNLPH